MYLKWLGCAFVIAGCAGTGFSMAAAYRKECRCLRQMVNILDYMECELQYRLTPLSELCRQASVHADGNVRKLYRVFADELDKQLSPKAERCMELALKSVPYLPPITVKMAEDLGRSLGVFDLEGQLKSLRTVRQACRNELTRLTDDQQTQLRSYQTLGVCAGAALVILFI